MSGRTRGQLLLLGGIVVGSALFAMGYGPIIGRFQGFDAPPEVLLRFAVHGVMFGLSIGWFEVFYARGKGAEWFRRLPFCASVLVKTALMTAIIVAVLLFGGMIVLPERLAASNAPTFFAVDVVVAFALALVFQLILAVRSVVGGRVLGNMMISRFFFDVAQATVAYGGETHRYIGDEVVVTWPLVKGIRDAACLQCCFAINDRIAERAADYRKRFGAVPTYRIGLHGGPVVAAECGDDKHEIVYFGDTVNTAARIEEYCKESGNPLLVSGELLAMMELPDSISASPVGGVRLRGRTSETDIYKVVRSNG